MMVFQVLGYTFEHSKNMLVTSSLKNTFGQNKRSIQISCSLFHFSSIRSHEEIVSTLTGVFRPEKCHMWQRSVQCVNFLSFHCLGVYV